VKRISILLLLAAAALVVVGWQTSSAAVAPDTNVPTIQPPADDGTNGESPDQLASFLQGVMDDVNNSWAQKFQAAGQTYQPAQLSLYQGGTYTACGATDGSVGPFYCPADQTVYLGLDFFQVMEQNLGATGDFAKAYVVAHEVGHHVQNLLGLAPTTGDSASQQSIDTELQADCLAGVWGNDAQQRGLLQDGDLMEGLNAAASVGDDVLEQSAGQPVNPDTFTHGTAKERASWLLRGFDTGKVSDCDTFAVH
jgi:predicted metalloprotease